MLHLAPESFAEPRPLAYAEAVSRLASVRHALRLVEPFGHGPASDPANDDDICTAWDAAGDARQRCFDRRSERMVGATAAGLEAILAERGQGREPHPEASRALSDEIRRELREIAGIILG
jgi:hypothetical protein